MLGAEEVPGSLFFPFCAVRGKHAGLIEPKSKCHSLKDLILMDGFFGGRSQRRVTENGVILLFPFFFPHFCFHIRKELGDAARWLQKWVKCEKLWLAMPCPHSQGQHGDQGWNAGCQNTGTRSRPSPSRVPIPGKQLAAFLHWVLVLAEPTVFSLYFPWQSGIPLPP